MNKGNILMFLLLLPASVVYCQAVALEQWENRHPEASQALGNWVHQFPLAAHEVFEWDGNHPDRSQEFVNWCITHPSEKLSVFIALHPDWPIVDAFMKRHPAATEEFMFWCRNHAIAAKALMAHSRGLKWAGDHLYREYMNMEHRR